eukprot:TRINITY_DN62631_c0_g1_i1.p1 TRINITY_DN62631_c0_g1~~TRINITY_DN62631_c0_g1_i1.p1  ORF type:complete len:1086 (-),score=257.80 TRINITY_DN62631_c0_g1_i1:138-3299(-)
MALSSSPSRQATDVAERRLKELLVEEAQEAERLSVELHSRDWERRQLLQLLHEKDAQIAHERASVEKQRVAVASSRQMARHWRAICTLRAWREEVRRVGADRLTTRTRQRYAVSRVTHACGVLRVTLRVAIARRLVDAVHCLWLHATSRRLQFPAPAPSGLGSLVDDVAEFGDAIEKALRGSGGSCIDLTESHFAPSTPQTSVAGVKTLASAAPAILCASSWSPPPLQRTSMPSINDDRSVDECALSSSPPPQNMTAVPRRRLNVASTALPASPIRRWSRSTTPPRLSWQCRSEGSSAAIPSGTQRNCRWPQTSGTVQPPQFSMPHQTDQSQTQPPPTRQLGNQTPPPMRLLEDEALVDLTPRHDSPLASNGCRSTQQRLEWHPSPCLKDARERKGVTSSEASTCASSSLASQSCNTSACVGFVSNLGVSASLDDVSGLSASAVHPRNPQRFGGTPPQPLPCRPLLRIPAVDDAASASLAATASVAAAAAAVESAAAWESRHAAAERTLAERSTRVEMLSGQVAQLDELVVQFTEQAESHVGEWRSTCDSLEKKVEGLAEGEARLQSALLETRTSEAMAEEAAFQRLRTEERRHEARCLDEHEEFKREAEMSRRRLEAKLEHGSAWRTEAEDRIRSMVACGEQLERERSRLRQQLAEMRHRMKSHAGEVESLRCSFHQETEMGELLRARAWALEQDNGTLRERARSAEGERRICADGSQREHAELLANLAKCHAELTFAQQQNDRLSAKVEAEASESQHRRFAFERAEAACHEARVDATAAAAAAVATRAAAEAQAVAAAAAAGAAEAGARRGAEAEAAARRDLLGVLDNERAQWSKEREELFCSASTALAELTDARQAEAAWSRFAKEAETAALAEASGEVAVCKAMAEQLRSRLTELQKEREAIHGIAGGGVNVHDGGCNAWAPTASSSTAPSEPATPRLQELDAYAMLVDRLRSEMMREREEREATGRTLASLRGSYRMLLLRSSGEGTAAAAAAAAVAPGGTEEDVASSRCLLGAGAVRDAADRVSMGSSRFHAAVGATGGRLAAWAAH